MNLVHFPWLLEKSNFVGGNLWHKNISNLNTLEVPISKHPLKWEFQVFRDTLMLRRKSLEDALRSSNNSSNAKLHILAATVAIDPVFFESCKESPYCAPPHSVCFLVSPMKRTSAIFWCLPCNGSCSELVSLFSPQSGPLLIDGAMGPL